MLLCSYLLPLLLFLCTWISTPYSWPLSAALLLSVLYFWKITPAISHKLKTYQFLFALIIICVWVYSAGIGQFHYQNFDYTKHNSIFYELMHEQYPIVKTINHKIYVLTYYLGHYIFPSLMGSAFGQSALHFADYLLSSLQILFIYLVIISLFEFKHSLLFLCVWILFGGLEFIGVKIYPEILTGFGELPEWWAGSQTFQYSSMTDLLYWVPQHALGSWGALSLSLFFFRYNIFVIPLLCTSILFFSPFATLALLPICLVVILHHLNKKDILHLLGHSIFPLITLVILYLYLHSSIYPQPLELQFRRMGSVFWIKYPLFIFLEIFFPAVFIFKYYDFAKYPYKTLTFLSLLFLLILPHIYFGIFSDLSMRTSAPLLFFLVILFYKSCELKKTTGYIILALYMCLGSYSAISDFYRSTKYAGYVIPYVPIEMLGMDGLSLQYLSDENSIFYKYLMKKNN
jgi:hypothetical protein